MQCKHIKQNGEQCQCHALKDDEYCFRHTTKIPAEVKRQWSVKGGYNRKPRMEKPIELLELNKPDDIVLLLGNCINMLLHGQIDGKLANSIAFMCNPLLRALEISELTKRVEKLETFIEEKLI